MRFFKLRYALVGWIVTRIARRRLVRMLHTATGQRRHRRGVALAVRRRI
jgi:hypothetical protein